MPASTISMQVCQSSLQKENQAAISEVLQSEKLLRTIDILPNKRLSFQVCSWEQYWKPEIYAFAPDQIKLLHQLERYQSKYIKSCFDLPLAQDYCYSYFLLLKKVHSLLPQNKVFQTVLGKMLSMESTVLHEGATFESCAAVTSNVRNPIYLLSKIRCPQVYDDPKFLPLLTACRSVDFSLDFIDVFYHYRQYSIDVKRKISLFVYPAAALDHRAGSFRCIQKFSSALTRKFDPRSKSRAKCISDYAIEPLINNGFEPCLRTVFSFVDLGGGSGSLSQRIFERLTENNPDIFVRIKSIGLWLIFSHTIHVGF